MIIDTVWNQITVTDWSIVIELHIPWWDEGRLLKNYIETTDTESTAIQIPLWRLKNMKYLSKIIYKMYQDNKMTENQLIPVPVSLWYLIGEDITILDTCSNLNQSEIDKIDNLLNEIDSEDDTLFWDNQATMFVSKAKTNFDKVVSKLSLSGRYVVGPVYTVAEEYVGQTKIKVSMRTPVSK